MKERIKVVIKEDLVDVAIQCLVEFEFCFALSETELNLYIPRNSKRKSETYMIPSLRPFGDIALSPSGKMSLLIKMQS